MRHRTLPGSQWRQGTPAVTAREVAPLFQPCTAPNQRLICFASFAWCLVPLHEIGGGGVIYSFMVLCFKIPPFLGILLLFYNNYCLLKTFMIDIF